MLLEALLQQDFLSPDERRDLQFKRLKATLKRVYEHVPFYRTRLEERQITPDTLTSLDELSTLPFTTRDDLLDHYPFGLLSVPREELLRIQASSGTKGRAKIIGYTRHDLSLWSEVSARSLLCMGIQPGDLLVNAYTYGLFTGGLGIHSGAELLGVTVVPTSTGNTRRQVTLLHDLQATALGCTPSYALVIGETMAAMGIEATSLRYGIFGAEPWTEAIRQQIESRLGLSGFDLYGLSEIIGPGVAVECPASRDEARRSGTRFLHVFEDHFYPEIISANGDALPPGQEGELVLTTLTREGMPLLRYRTGDICSLHTVPCACGRTLMRISQIKGRTDDMLILRGINVYPTEIERVLMSLPELSPYYYIVIERQQSLDSVTVEVELADPDASPDAHQQLQETIGTLLLNASGLHFSVQLHRYGTLPRSEGKTTHIIDKRERGK
ncbi:phenylacetate-CoA ligase [Thermosporothrix hazakensis]|jgi:phenylacetate-CoA ligase|uniref:Phenylacetate-coenzyme A ligase n=1 Tax=Thermosporothrix hazakensis TaxID=644383 RepID=A0A326UDI5_THEHA|nr:phenylacetate--CoA ligase [Thermosporothrix hazakensis]PZW27466.1 phenylacetate-CoA ligase [Thermosporothrix hazakensis]GCE45632.1 phenylacetate-coenzyme A ligase [Thermosporothrix hazakensis]